MRTGDYETRTDKCDNKIRRKQLLKSNITLDG